MATSDWLPFGVLVYGALLSCQSQSQLDVETHTIKRGNFVNGVTVSGELEAVSSKMVTAPRISWRYGNLKVTKLVEDGGQVEEGDFLIQFDPGEVQKSVVDAEAELEIAQAELRKAEATKRSEHESMQIDLEISRIDHQIAQITLEQADFKAAIDRQKIAFDLENAAIALEKAGQELDSKTQIAREEMRKLALKVEQAQNKLDEAKETLGKLLVVAPAPGIAIIQKNWSTNSKFKVDDQSWPGQPVVGLPDLSRMQATVQVSEMDIAKIKVGLRTKVTLDAYADTSFPGQVREVATLARAKERESQVKVFDTIAELDGEDDKLLPGMTISCEIIVEQIADTLSVPLEAVFQREGKAVVFVYDGGDFVHHEVNLGQENDNFALVIAGLKEGDRVALSDPAQAGLGSDAAEEMEKAP